MLGTYYYHEIVRKTIIAFGTLFNDIHIRHQDGAGNDINDLKVPLAYGPSPKVFGKTSTATRFEQTSSDHNAKNVI